MSASKVPTTILTGGRSRAARPTPHLWRQGVALSVAWVALLVSLVALPGLLVFTTAAFLGILVGVLISWARASRADPDRRSQSVRSALPR